ncbi:MAG TPA: energy transducer TonB [Caldithrix abyssi]|uniref:Energy transducer TonB n=1 Tax=Caldithrix abyssi TaxID=187145 RepID=A0A7V1PTK8_CALAY|nr:energy transducer TonB [Caldithrix abyssi]
MQALKTDPSVDLKLKYRKVLQASSAAALFLLTILFYSFQKYDSTFQLEEQPELTIQTIEIPPTQQLQKPPPPSRPSIPVESEDEDLLDDVTIEETEIDLAQIDDAPPPPPEEDEVFEFFAVSEKPKLLHKETPKYPDLARRAGIEGRVTIMVTISKKGDVIDAKVLKSIPMLDDAALNAAKKCKFKPAKQRDRFVKVKMSIPFDFRLRN